MLSPIAIERIGRTWNWRLENRAALAAVKALAAKGEPVAVFQDAGRRDWWQKLGGWPHHFERLEAWPWESRWAALLVISDRDWTPIPAGLRDTTLYFRPPTLTVGISLLESAPAEEIAECIGVLFTRHRLSQLSITALAAIATHRDDPGLVDYVDEREIPLLTYALDKLKVVAKSDNAAADADTGNALAAACEPAAMLAAGVKELVVPKTDFPLLTLAVARRTTG